MLRSIQSFFTIHKSYTARVKFVKDNYPTLYSDTCGGDQIKLIYDFLHNVVATPLCATCQLTPVKFDTFLTGYRTYCCHQCSVSNPATILKRENTLMENYGHKSALGCESIREKQKKTMIERYGVEHILQNDKFKNQVVTKNTEKSVLEKKDIRARKTSTIIARYGSKNMWEVQQITDKRKLTCLKKFGVEFALQSHLVKEKSKLSKTATFVASLPSKFTNVMPMFTASEFTGVATSYLWKCLDCSTVFKDHIDDGSKPVCPTCFPKFGSVGETEVVTFVTSLGVDIEIHNHEILRPKELDILVQSKHVAIEYCGLYWHSEKKVSSDYHLKKFQDCRSKGIQLITIFEDEWLFKKDICKDILTKILGKDSHELNDDSPVVIRLISTKLYRDYLSATHIHGYTPAAIRLGAFRDDKLIAVMGFSKVKNSSTDYQLVSHCEEGNSVTVSTKLMHYFESNYSPTSIIGCCDLRWDNGNMYLLLGFKEHSTSPPAYYWSNDGLHRYSRTTAFAKTHYRIYDCGSIEFIKEIPAIPAAAIQP